MKGSFKHIFLKNAVALIGDLLSNVNRARRLVCMLLWFSSSLSIEAQHINNNRSRLDSLHKRSNASYRLLTNTYNVTGGGSYCSGGAGLPVGLDGSEAGGSYQLQLNGVDAGAPVTGTGSAFDFPNQTAAGTYTVVGTVGGVPVTMNGNAVITINSPPTAFSSSNSPQCTGSTLNLTASGGVTYSWTGPNGFTSGSQNPSVANVSTAADGTYTVTVIDANGCSASATTSVTITALPTASISYSGTPFCTTVNTTQAVTLSGTGAYTGGTYSAPAGLTIDASTGAITPGTSTPGTYIVTYTTPASGGCAAVTATTSVTITALPTASISYSGTPFCTTINIAQAVTLSGTGAYTGGTYSASPAGLIINSSTGAITPSTSTAGTYTVTYTTPASAGCAAVNTTALVTITAAPVATFSYAGTPYCQNAGNPSPAFSGGGVAGVFSASPVGLVFISTSTGQVDLTASTPGNYTVTNTIAASGGCATVTATSSITITAVPSATVSYAGNPFCKSLATAQSVTLTGTGAYTGGTYTASPVGLTISSSTGAITPSTSTSGTYTVTYTTPASGGCAAVTATTSVTITALPTASISYSGTPFCTTVNTAQAVTLSGTGAYTGGTYSASAGLTIDALTGAITPGSSSPGAYTVTYTTPASAGCAAVTATANVTITALPTANVTYSGSPFCKSVATAQSATLTGTGAYTGGTYSASPAGLIINSSTGAITPSTSTAGTYTVTYTTPASGGCAAVTATSSVTITAVPTATISYSGTPFCTTVGSAPVTLTGTGAYTGGTFSSTAGLIINSSTGEITPSSSTAGSYTVTYAIPASGGCAAINVTTPVTITAMPTASLSYSGNPFCRSVSTAQNPTLTGTNAYTGGTYAAPAGLTINSGTGAITPSTSTPGTYTVTYTKSAAGGCAAVVATASVTVTVVPTANISYSGGPFCTTVNSAPVTLTGTGAYTGGTFSSTAGLIINSSTGQITPSSSTAGTYTVTYVVPASGGCATVNATTTVTITAMPTATLSYSGNPFCRSVSTAQPATLTGTGVFTGGTYSAAPGGLTINNGTGAITPSSSTPGTYTVTYTKAAAGGCAAVTATTSVTITAAPTATISYAGTPFCTSVSSASVTLSGTGAYMGGTFSAPGALTINSTTGAITPLSSTAGTYTVTYTVPASGGCAAVNATTSVTINASPAVSVTPATAAFCSGNSVTLTASGASTYTWSPSTNLSITTGSVVIAYPDVTTTYTVTGTAANGCTATASVPITVTTSPEGDLSSSPPVCPGSNSGTVTLSNYTGNIIRWETSTDGGANWTTVNNTNTSLAYLNLTSTTIYRVYLQLNGCFAYSDVGIVPVNPTFTPTVTVNPASICLGQSATLKASDYGAPPFPVEDFQNANPSGWNGNDANSNNKNDNSEWGESGNGKTFNGVLFNSNATPTNSKFMIVNGNGGGSVVSLVTPPFSLVGLTNPIFNYYTAMNLNVGTTAWVEISTDGGTNYNTLKTYTGPTNVGNPNNGFIQESINLSAYIGQPNVKIRFRYSGTTGSNWAVDNVGIGGTYQPVTYQWSPLTYLTPSNGVGQTVTTTPTVSGTYNYCVVATTAAGCASSPVCADVIIKPLPTCSISGTDSVCPASTNTYSAPASLSAYSWSITGKGTISGSSTGQTVSVLARGTCGTYTLNLTTTLNGCTSTCSRMFTIYDTTRPVITVAASSSIGCNPSASAILAAFGTGTVTDNCTTGLTATFTDGAEQGTGCIRTVTRTWTVTDSCGNAATPVTQTVTFTRDTEVPVITLTSAATLSCNPEQADINAAFGTATVTDNCSAGLVATGTVGAETNSGCTTYSVTKNWTVTDACGNTATASQTITFTRDTQAPVITLLPATSVGCNPTAATIDASFGNATVTDNCSTGLIATGTIGAEVLVSGCTYSVTKNWTVSDNCGNNAIAMQTVTFTRDVTVPVLNNVPGNATVQCNSIPAAAAVTATDNCDASVIVTMNETNSVTDGCGTITRTWTATDACGNTANATQVLTVIDNTPPVVTCPPAQVFCEANSNNYTIPLLTASDNCSSALTISYEVTGATTRSGTGTDASGIFNTGISTITWTVKDACGNVSTCTTLVNISAIPTPIITHN